MNETCVDLLAALLRSGGTLTCAAVAVLVFQRIVPVSSIRLRRWMWFAVILQGCLLVRIPMTLSLVPAVHNLVVSQPSESAETSSVFERPNIAIVVADVLFNSDLVEAETKARLTGGWWGLPWATILAAVWALGIVSLLVRSGRHYCQFLRSLPPLAPVPQEWMDELNSLRSDVGEFGAEVRQRVTLRGVPHVGPLLCWHPRGYQLIVPTDIWRLLKPQQRLMILQHELAHLERGDIWKSFVLRLLALPHWFNPFAWHIVNQFDDDAEHACDDTIRRASPQNAIEYARTLLLLGGSRQATFFAPRAIGGHGLADRIRRLTVSNSRKDSNMKRIVILSGSIGISLISLLRFQIMAEERPIPTAQVVPSASGLSQLENGAALNVTLGNATSTLANTNPTEAVVDVGVLFKHSLKFAHDREKLKSHIADLERSFKEDSEIAKRDGSEQKTIELELSRQRTSEGLLAMEREIYIGTFKTIGEEIRQYAKANGIRLVRRRNSNPMTLSFAGSVIDNPAIGISGVTIKGGIERGAIIVTSSGTQQGATVQLNVFTDAPQENESHSVLVAEGPTNAIAIDDPSKVFRASQSSYFGFSDIKDGNGQPAGVAVADSGVNLTNTVVNVAVADRPADGSRARPFNTIYNTFQLKANTVNSLTVTGTEKSGDSYQRMLQQEVLYVEPGEELDITQEILNRMNAKFQTGTEQPKP
ncbi:M56 family metallopeptidase [Schlesneria paludicola]|uniref:M56 family metallopeptidase n=1 Tax=Schlesneria paludicola TaxID=360056 RepID=UPI00029A40BE|nr:M56 family metallopeptidase [Schlesneria paludicola]